MKKIAFVCTGNTCRSPMAEYIMKDLLRKNSIEGYEVISFGVYAVKGSPISAYANEVLKKRGICAVDHIAKGVEQINECDMIIAMTNMHLEALGAPKNAYTLDKLTACGEVLDPYGRGLDEYEACASQIQQAIESLIDKISSLFDNNI